LLREGEVLVLCAQPRKLQLLVIHAAGDSLNPSAILVSNATVQLAGQLVHFVTKVLDDLVQRRDRAVRGDERVHSHDFVGVSEKHVGWIIP